MKTIFETGATSHAVNDLILFADNTRELVEIRDEIYKDIINNNRPLMWKSFLNLSGAAKIAYRKEFKNIEDHSHIRNMTESQTKEFCLLYLHDFNNWKLDHNYN
jgi:hypothetical protein